MGTGDGHWNTLQRVSYVRLKGRWVAYPFQNNVSALSTDDQIACLTGLVDAKVRHATSAAGPKDFDEWILRTQVRRSRDTRSQEVPDWVPPPLSPVQGTGIADLFMRPYNFKVWAVPTTHMQCAWLGERVAAPDVGRAIANVLRGTEDAGWGPNAVFRFPKHGGTGAIWKGVAKLLPVEKQHYGQQCTVTALDAGAKTVTLAGGQQVQYNSLISTMPLDITLRMLGKPEWADGLTHSSSHIIGVGIRGANPHTNKCWLYFPEDNCPFYRRARRRGGVERCTTHAHATPFSFSERRCSPTTRRPTARPLTRSSPPCAPATAPPWPARRRRSRGLSGHSCLKVCALTGACIASLSLCLTHISHLPSSTQCPSRS